MRLCDQYTECKVVLTRVLTGKTTPNPWEAARRAAAEGSDKVGSRLLSCEVQKKNRPRCVNGLRGNVNGTSTLFGPLRNFVVHLLYLETTGREDGEISSGK